MKSLYPANCRKGRCTACLLQFFLIASAQLLLMTAALAQTNPQQYRWSGAGATDRWDNPENWIIDGVPGLSSDAPPGSDDDVSFNAANLAPGGHTTVFVEYNRPNFCNNMDWSGAAGMTFTGDGNAELQVFGGITLAAGSNNLNFTFPGTIRLRDQTGGPNSVNIMSAGQQLTCTLDFDGVREWHLVDDFWAQYVLQSKGKIVSLANIKTNSAWIANGDAGDCALTLQPGSTFNCGHVINLGFMLAVDFSAASTDFLFPNPGGEIRSYNGGLEVHNVTYLSSGAIAAITSNGKVEFFGDGFSNASNNFNDLVFHENGTFFDIGFGNGNTPAKNVTLAPGKIYNFRGCRCVIKSGGSLTADGGSCATVITLETTEGSPTFSGFASEGPNLSLRWCTLFNINAFAYAGSPTFTAQDCVDLNPGGSPGWAITGPSGQNVYWMGGAGDNDWFTPGNWSTGCVPNAYDDVYFDKNLADPAGLGNSQCVITGQQYAYCRSMIWQNWPGGVQPTLLSNFSMAPQTLFVYGHLIFQEAGCNNFQGEVVFRKDLTETHTGCPANPPVGQTPPFCPIVQKSITSAGNHFQKNVRLSGHNDTYTLTDDSYFDIFIYHTDGFLVNPPNKTMTIASGFYGPGQGFDFHNSLIKFINTSQFYCGYPSFNSTLSTVWMTQGGQIFGGANIFHDVLYEGNAGDFEYAGTDNSGTVTFKNTGQLYGGNFIHHAIFQVNGTIYGSYSLDQLDFAPGYYYTLADGASIQINNTPTSHFNASGADCSHYTYLMGTGPNPATITNLDPAFNLHFDNITLRNVQHGGGSGTYTATGVQMENVLWNFTNPQTARKLYWTAGSGDWFDAGNWSVGSATGPVADCPPDWNDDVYFGWDTDLSGQTVTLNVGGEHAFCHNMDWSHCPAILNSPPYFRQYSTALFIYGSLKFTPGLDFSNTSFGSTYFMSDQTEDIISAGQRIGNANFYGNGTWNFLDPFGVGYGLYHYHGTINTNDQPVYIHYAYEAFPGGAVLMASNSDFVLSEGYSGGHIYFNNYSAGNLHVENANFTFHNGGTFYGNSSDAVKSITFKKFAPYDGSNYSWSGAVTNQSLAHDVSFLEGVSGIWQNSKTITGKLLFEENGTIVGNDHFSTTITPNPTPASAIDPYASIAISPAPVDVINEAEFLKNGSIQSNTAFRHLKLYGGNEYTITAGKTVDILPAGTFDILQLSGFTPATVRSSDPVQNPQLANFGHIYKDGSNLCADYLYLDNINRDGSAKFHDFSNFNNINATNYGWDFTALCPVCPPFTQTAPALNTTLSVTKAQMGGQPTLVLDNLPAGYEAVWFNKTQTAELYHSAANQFQPTIQPADYDPNDLPVVFLGAIREIATGCLSPVLTVPICILADVPTFSGNTAICPGGSTTLHIASGNLYDATEWDWYEGVCSGTPIGTGTSISVMPAAARTYFAVGAGGCAMDMGVCGQVNVTINQPVAAASSNTPLCTGSGDLLLFESGGTAASWSWTGPGGFASTAQNPALPNPMPANSGAYTVVATDGLGCMASQTISVVVSQSPDMDQPANQVVCAGAPTAATVFSSTPAGASFNWTNDNTSIGLAASGSGDIGSFPAVNNGATPQVATVTVTPLAGGSFAYIPNTGSNNVSVINTLTQTVVATIPVQNFPIGVSATPDGSRVYVTNTFSKTVSVISTATNTVIATVEVGLYPNGLRVSPDGSKVYVANEGLPGPSYEISVINTATNLVDATISVDYSPVSLSFSPDGSKLYVANRYADNFSVINTATNTVIATNPAGDYPLNLCTSPDGSKVFIVNLLSYDVSVVDAASNTVINTIPVGNHPLAAAISPDGSRVYVSNGNDNTVSVINTLTNTVDATIIVGNQPDGLYFSPDGSQVYVANIGSNDVSVINTLTNMVEATIPVGIGPRAVGNFFAGSPCSGVPKQFTITVNPLPALNCPPNQTVCLTALPLDLEGLGASPVGGTFSGAGVSGSNYSAVVGATDMVTYHYTDGNDCSNTCTFTVSVTPSPVAAISGDLSICSEETTVLTATGGTTYAWNTGATTDAITEDGGIYTVTATDAEGCTAVAMATVDQWQPPAVQVVVSDPYCINGNLTMMETGGQATGWSWSGPFGFNSTLQNPVIPNATEIWATGVNEYGVTITDAHGCTNSTMFRINDFIPVTTITNTVSNQTLCAGAMTAAVNFTANIPQSTFSWTNNLPGIGLPASGSGNIGAFTAVNNSHATITATITVTPMYQGCAGTPKLFTITVYPQPMVTCPASSTVCISTAPFVLTGGAPAGGTYSGPGVSGGQFNPAAAGTGVKTITYTYTDAHNCTGSCTFTITVSSCVINFSGQIRFSNNPALGVKDALVSLSGSFLGSSFSDMNGNFSITATVSSGSFTLKPTKTINKLNGLTAADIAAIQQHVAHTILITNPYKYVAADVNMSNSINSMDASLINQALLGNPVALAQINPSWHFVPTSYNLTIPPWGFPEQRTYTNINTAQTNQDFYGIKTGDVATVYANPTNFGAGEPLVLRTRDRVLQAGEAFDVTVSADQLNDLAAFQLALTFDPGKIQFEAAAALPGLPLSADNFGTYNAGSGEIRVVWAQPEGIDVAEGAPAFRLRFKALESGARLSALIHLDDEALPARTYNSTLAESPLWLRFGETTGTVNPSTANGVQLFQNRPNPFRGTTAIGFVLPEACDAQLRVYDPAGRLLAERRAFYPAGKNEVVFDLSGSQGVLYYALTTPFGVLSRKMMPTGD